MNAKYWYIALLTSFLIIPGCNNGPSPALPPEFEQEQMHREHSNLADNLAHKKIIILEKPYKPSQAFEYPVTMLFESYLKLKEALVKDDTITANHAAKDMKFMLDLIPEPLSDEKARDTWRNHKEGYLNNLTGFLLVEDLEKKRSYFSHISEIFYCTLKSFDLEIGDVHVAYCPMVFDNKGAYWLTDSHKIRNPYFGNQMPKCGTITEIIP